LALRISAGNHQGDRRNMKTDNKQIYLARNKHKKSYRVFTFEAIRNAAEEYAFKKYGKRSFSLACHMALYRTLRDAGFINLRKLLIENKLNRGITYNQ
jgi:hypothetical protein